MYKYGTKDAFPKNSRAFFLFSNPKTSGVSLKGGIYFSVCRDVIGSLPAIFLIGKIIWKLEK